MSEKKIDPQEETVEHAAFMYSLRNGESPSGIVDGVLDDILKEADEVYEAMTGAADGDWKEGTFRDGLITRMGFLLQLIGNYNSLDWTQIDPVKDNSLTSQK